MVLSPESIGHIVAFGFLRAFKSISPQRTQRKDKKEQDRIFILFFFAPFASFAVDIFFLVPERAWKL
jgi:hypothetical protein